MITPLKTNTLIILDLDGTLYKTGSSFFHSVRLFMNKYNLPCPDMDFIENLIGEKSNVFEEWLNSLNLGKPTDYLNNELNQIDLQSILEIGELFEGVEYTLSKLHNAGCTIGICSNGSRWYIEAVLNKFDLQQFLSFVRYPGNQSESKSEMVKKIIGDFSAREIYFLGDRYHDFKAASENNIVSIGAAYGYGKREVEKANIIIDTPVDLLKIVGI